MINTLRYAIVATILVSISSINASADDDVEEVEVSASVLLISDYRFRGVSLSDRDIAIQGDVGVSYKGFHIGAWASSIDDFSGTSASASTTEVDYVVGYSFGSGDVSFDAGLTFYTYPGSDGTAYWEPYVSAGTSIGGSDVSVLFAYVPSQDNSGNADNIYIAFDTSTPLGDSGVSFDGHLGYEDGAFGDGKWDWQAGVSMDLRGFDVGIAYIDTNVRGRLTKGAILFSFGKSF